jgi:4-diphosphocytidyl-2-C-methyl-D-erythritol kinase
MEDFCLQYRAFAKLNLFLHVLGRRKDGYHEIRSLMVTIGLADTLQFRKTPSGAVLRCDSPEVPLGKDNLCLAAARSLMEHADYSGGVEIILSKRIPIAAGLGGGSSDAACTLVALNELWQLRLSLETLETLAGGIGSDVPFFIRGGAQLAEGRGEKLTRLESAPELWFVILSPQARISSKQAYSAARIGLTGVGHEIRMKNLGMGLDAASVAGSLQNDLESGVIGIYPEVRELKDVLLAHGAMGSLMSGSGPAVFGIARDQTSASEIASGIVRPGLSAFVVRTVQQGSVMLDQGQSTARTT